MFPSGKSGWSSNPSGNTGSKPGGSFDSTAARAQRREESKTNYTKANPEKAFPSTNPANRTPPRSADPNTWRTDPRDRQIDELHRQLSYERWSNWDSRQRGFFGGYWGRPVVVYNDPYSSFFWWWLLDQSLDNRARWAYSHRYAMDDARYRELLAKDAQLEAKVRELENQKVARDPSWTPPGIEGDLVYKKEYVEEAQKRVDSNAGLPGPGGTQANFPGRVSLPGAGLPNVPSSGSHWMSFFLTMGIIAGLIWLVFFKRW